MAHLSVIWTAITSLITNNYAVIYARALPDVISNEIAGRNFKPAQKQIVYYKRLRYQRLYKLFNNSTLLYGPI